MSLQPIVHIQNKVYLHTVNALDYPRKYNKISF